MSEQACAFHPDRLTGVTCSRCGRPICPDDMIDAPVGIHCPVCAGRMREGAVGEATYRARVRLERVPLVRRIAASSLTMVLIGANVIVFALMALTGAPTSAPTLIRFGALTSPLYRSEWWRIFSAMFVHIGIAHLAFNMFALYLFGPPIEARYGKVRFLSLYLVSGALGSAASLAFTGPGLRAGASGGVFGILGGFIAFYLPHRHDRGARQQLQSLFFLVAINLFFGASIGGIDNAAHIGGLIGGVLAGSGLELQARFRRAPGAALLGLAGFGVAGILAIALIAANSLPG